MVKSTFMGSPGDLYSCFMKVIKIDHPPLYHMLLYNLHDFNFLVSLKLPAVIRKKLADSDNPALFICLICYFAFYSKTFLNHAYINPVPRFTGLSPFPQIFLNTVKH